MTCYPYTFMNQLKHITSYNIEFKGSPLISVKNDRIHTMYYLQPGVKIVLGQQRMCKVGGRSLLMKIFHKPKYGK
jgi:hypothetical protein